MNSESDIENEEIEDNEDIPIEHKAILDETIAEFESGRSEVMEWDEVIKKFFPDE